jgi:hypothetical protein
VPKGAIVSTTPPDEPTVETTPSADAPEDAETRVTAPADAPSAEQAARQVPSIAVVSSSGDVARLPIPGNAELAIWLLVVILFGIICLASDGVDAIDFVAATAVVTFAYLISRGIAKAGRVLEQ